MRYNAQYYFKPERAPRCQIMHTRQSKVANSIAANIIQPSSTRSMKTLIETRQEDKCTSAT